jgi:hypothetical protein
MTSMMGFFHRNVEFDARDDMIGTIAFAGRMPVARAWPDHHGTWIGRLGQRFLDDGVDLRVPCLG